MALLVRSLKASAPKEPNYRGTLVFNGLGIVWFVWILFFLIGASLYYLELEAFPDWMTFLMPVLPLIAGTCAFGMFDDWVRDRDAKGFTGHVRALAHGTITTGMLKMIGIGFLCLVTAFYMQRDYVHLGSPLLNVFRVVYPACFMALMANSMNLLDRRPARAGKVYLLGLVVAILVLALPIILSLGAEYYVWLGPVGYFGGSDIVALALAGLGPLLAVWRFDAGEQGMLGDAGANSMGAFLGYLFLYILPGAVVFFFIMPLLLFLNIVSERVSFSEVIEDNRVLRFFDRLGRKDV
jgi:UDP-N-acetylmuramyl pentapeptide phosphotransferase/UDP-N-acetylglucosamine-1-phosphate transferase